MMVILLLLLNTFIQPVPGLPHRLSYTYYFNEEFMTGTAVSGNIGCKRWVLNGAGGGTYQATVVEPGRFGVGRLTTGTTITGWSCISPPISTRFLGNMVIEIAVRLPTLSVSGNDYIVRFGMGENVAGAGEHNSGIYFRYYRLGSPNWQCVSANMGLNTVITTSVPVTTNWTRFRIKVNAARDRIEYFINDVSVAQITTNLPLNVPLRLHYKISKATGAATRYLDVDYFQVYADTDLRR